MFHQAPSRLRSGAKVDQCRAFALPKEATRHGQPLQATLRADVAHERVRHAALEAPGVHGLLVCSAARKKHQNRSRGPHGGLRGTAAEAGHPPPILSPHVLQRKQECKLLWKRSIATSRHLNLFLPRIVFTRSICRRFPGQPLHFCSSLAAEFVCDAVRVYSFSLPLPHVHTPSLRTRGFSFRLVATRQRSLLRRVHLLQYDLTEKPKRPFASFKSFGTMHEAVRFLTLVPVTNLRRQSTASVVLIERLGPMLSRRNLFERFRPFLESFRRFEFEFCRRGNYFKNNSIFVCSGFDHMQCNCTCVCAVACFHTCVDQMQTHRSQTLTNNMHSTGTSHFHSNCGCVLDDS